MVLVYLFASLLGALTTVAVLLPYGWLLALSCAPIGASALGLIVAVGIYVARTGKASLRPAAVSARS
jgi:hypothetical protein